MLLLGGTTLKEQMIIQVAKAIHSTINLSIIFTNKTDENLPSFDELVSTLKKRKVPKRFSLLIAKRISRSYKPSTNNSGDHRHASPDNASKTGGMSIKSQHPKLAKCTKDLE